MPIRADLEWYTDKSRQAGVPPRCPFATVHRCPRFYQSISLFGDCAGTTKMDPKEDEVLLEKWKQSDMWPVIGEQATSVFSAGDRAKMFNRFCPEASFERFGLFATDIYDYTDSIDREAAHARLKRSGSQAEDWRWTWELIHPAHYTECPLYSLLLHNQNMNNPKQERTSRPSSISGQNSGE